jgi:hypothetical protein
MKQGIAPAKTPRAPSSEVYFLCGPFDLAQDMLCAFAGDIPIFGFAVSPGWASVVKISSHETRKNRIYWR